MRKQIFIFVKPILTEIPDGWNRKTAQQRRDYCLDVVNEHTDYVYDICLDVDSLQTRDNVNKAPGLG